MAARKKEESTKQRYQANARERDRTHRVRSANSYKTQEFQSSLCSVNTAFSALRTLIPTEPVDRKLSKIETLRLASSYINHLGAVLVAGPIDQPCSRVEDNSVYWTNHWTDLQTRPQVCTFCLTMHKKYSLNSASEVISDYQIPERSLYDIPTSSAMYLNLNNV
ncbi:transcription factor 15-like isoform X1 [Colletes gigas]|uniref:transcription factor 15-like isoform X1 n=1 Tax=Colletes gigas TaxID=935657 RepID=UPI001C9A9BCD|nr:transcription factor 15-like isoform X1 [Colletes gigas]